MLRRLWSAVPYAASAAGYCGAAGPVAREFSCRASLDSAASIDSVERLLGDVALERGWSFDPPAGTQPQAGAHRRRRAERPIHRLPPGLPGPRRRDKGQRRPARRDDASRQPLLPMPRGVLDAEVDRIARLGVRMTCGRGADRGRGVRPAQCRPGRPAFDRAARRRPGVPEATKPHVHQQRIVCAGD